MTERVWESLDDIIERITDREGAETMDVHIPFAGPEWNRVVIDIQGRQLREAETWKMLLLPALRTGAVIGGWRFADNPDATPQLLHFSHWHTIEQREDATRSLRAMTARRGGARSVSGRIRADPHPREIEVMVDATQVDALLAAMVPAQVESELTPIIPLRGYTQDQLQQARAWLRAQPDFFNQSRGDSLRALLVEASKDASADELKGIKFTHRLLRHLIRHCPDLKKPSQKDRAKFGTSPESVGTSSGRA